LKLDLLSILIMWKSDKKFYVVWKWKNNWIFDSWDSCKENVIWFSDAKYKAFSSIDEAEIALKEWWEKYYEVKNSTKKEKIDNENIPFFAESIAVDAACSWNPWEMEYRWIDLQTWEEIFHKKYKIWTNNIWEFLAIVDWLKYLWDDNRAIYSDSRIAISRINQWKCKTQIKVDWSLESDLWTTLEAVKIAEKWLKDNWIKHKILKRETEDWWEIPADFWRK
jgi:ribonuclease HI